MEISSSCTFDRVTLWRYRDEFPRWTISGAWYPRKLDNSYCDSSGRNGNNVGGIVGCVIMLVSAWNSMSCREYRQRCSRELYRVSNDATRCKRRANCMVHNRTALSLSLTLSSFDFHFLPRCAAFCAESDRKSVIPDIEPLNNIHGAINHLSR